jgi:hypothetical protein
MRVSLMVLLVLAGCKPESTVNDVEPSNVAIQTTETETPLGDSSEAQDDSTNRQDRDELERELWQLAFDESWDRTKLNDSLRAMIKSQDLRYVQSLQEVLVEFDRRRNSYLDQQQEWVRDLSPEFKDPRISKVPWYSLPGYDENYGQPGFKVEQYAEILDFLTAMRRIEGIDDPLKVSIVDATVNNEWPTLPRVTLLFQNVDSSKRSFELNLAPSYFEIELRNDNTQQLKRLEILPHRRGVGSGYGPLQHFEGQILELPLSDYTTELEPGEYSISVHCRPAGSMRPGADFAYQSKVSWFDVSPRYVYQSDSEAEEIRALLKAIDRSKPPVLIDRETSIGEAYGLWATRAIPVESPVGRILIQGWSAVPILLEELRDTNLSLQERSHTLAFLYSITGQLSPLHERSIRNGVAQPRQAPALGPFVLVSSYFGFNDTENLLAPHARVVRVGFDEPPDESERESVLILNDTEQQELVDHWLRISEYIEVVVPVSTPQNIPEGFGRGKGFF